MPLYLVLISVLILAFNPLMAADFLETKYDFFSGKQFRVIGGSDWHEVGSGGEIINARLQKYPEALKKYEDAQFNWMLGWGGYVVGTAMMLNTISVNKVEYSYLAGYVVALVGFGLATADEQEAVIIYNDRESGRHSAVPGAFITIAAQIW